MIVEEKSVEHLVVDTTAFIHNAPLQQLATNIYTIQEVVDEIVNKRQLRRLCVLPYDLRIKDVYPENIQTVTDFSKKTGDYPSLSATDIKVMALTYQLEKEYVGSNHIRTAPVMARTINLGNPNVPDMNADLTGFYAPKRKSTRSRNNTSNSNTDKTSEEDEKCDIEQLNDGIDNIAVEDNSDQSDNCYESYEESDDEDSWITPSNIQAAKKQVNSELMEAKKVVVSCITTDFAMQNVLKQMNLNVSALDGRIIKQLRTFVLRCYTCFGTTSIMTKQFCGKCGNNTLKKVAVSLDEDGKQQIHINTRRPLTGRGKRFSMPTMKGGKHANNPRLVEDQPMPDQRPSRIARMKNNPMADDYIAGYSPFVTRDVNSKSAQLCIRPGDVKHWMKKNPNEARRHRKK